jgi:restriction system protein
MGCDVVDHGSAERLGLDRYGGARVAVPDFQTLMRPLLASLEDGSDHSIKQVREELAREFALSDEDLAEELPSGRAKTFANRVGWATTYLYRCGLLERPRRSVYRLTDRGRDVMLTNPARVDLKVLSQFPEFAEFRQTQGSVADLPKRGTEVTGEVSQDQTPEEQIDSAYRDLRAALAAEVLDRVSEQPPEFFEQLVLDVLSAMGYGGTREGAAQRLGKSGDGGVDGVISEDRLGLDQIYVQAKRWKDSVGRPEIQKFFGALHGQRATKGVFITTSAFTKDAVDYAESVTPRVILVDGKELAELMIDHDVGVTVARSYRLKRLDLDYSRRRSRTCRRQLKARSASGRSAGLAPPVSPGRRAVQQDRADSEGSGRLTEGVARASQTPARTAAKRPPAVRRRRRPQAAALERRRESPHGCRGGLGAAAIAGARAARRA